MSVPEWVKNNWDGIMIRVENEAFTGLSYSVPGWKCRHCGWKIGSLRGPPKTCPHCNHSSEAPKEGALL